MRILLLLGDSASYTTVATAAAGALLLRLERCQSDCAMKPEPNAKNTRELVMHDGQSGISLRFIKEWKPSQEPVGCFVVWVSKAWLEVLKKI